MPRGRLLDARECRGLPPAPARARSSAAARSSGSGGRELERLAGERVRRTPARALCRNWRSRPWRAGVAVARVAGDRVRRSRRSGRGSGACARSPGGPRPGVSAGSTSMTSKWVRAARAPAAADGPLLRRAVVAAERRVDRAGARSRAALDERQVGAPELAALDHRREAAVRLVVAGDDHQAGGVLVEPVDDPGPLGLAAAEQVAERVDEGGAAVAGRRVDHEPGGLVDRPPGARRRGRAAARGSSRRCPPLRRGERGERDHHHARGDRDVGDVERRPERRVDEVGDRAVADPVGEVAERAAGRSGRRPATAPGAACRRRTSRGSAPGRRA